MISDTHINFLYVVVIELYISGVSVCHFVALWLCDFVALYVRMFVAGANKVEGIMS